MIESNEKGSILDQAAIDQYVAATAGLYKKADNPDRNAAVTASVRAYAENVLPGLMIGRRDPVVLATEDEDFK